MNAIIFFNDGTGPLVYEVWRDDETIRMNHNPYSVFYNDLESAGRTGFLRAGKEFYVPVRRIHEIRTDFDDKIHKLSYRTFNQDK